MKFLSKVAVTFAVFLLSILPVKADITDGKFGINQIFDVQYYWSGTTLNASNFISPYNMNFQHLPGCTATSCSIPSGSYFQFFASTTNPGTYGLALYNANGTVNTVMHNYGNITALGNGAIFYVGSGWLGNVITPSTGYNYGDNAQFTNMDTSVTAGDLSGYTWASTTPLAAGQTAGSGSTPTVVSTASGTPVVSTSTSAGITTSTTVDTAGTPTSVTTVTDSRGSQGDKELTITRNTTVVTTTPVTRVVTDTTPVTTTTVTTPTTVTTYSDGSTTTTNGTPVTTTSTTNQVVTTTSTLNTVISTSANQEYTTRIDQYTVLAQTNSFANLLNSNDQLNRHVIIDGDLMFRGNVDSDRNVSFYTLGERAGEYANDGYTISTSRYGFGLDKLVRNNWVIGLNVSRSSSNMSGNDASGNLYKDMIALNSTNVIKNWIVSSQLGYSRNAIDATHSLPAFGYSNSSSTNGDDYWFTARLYTPDFRGLRPFVGGRVENNRRDAVAEAGSVLTAMSYDAVNTTSNTAHYGLRFDRQVKSFNFYAEASQNSNNVLISRIGVGKQLTEKVAIVVGAAHVKKDSITSTAGSIMLRIGF
jgi:hypothetical protein